MHSCPYCGEPCGCPAQDEDDCGHCLYIDDHPGDEDMAAADGVFDEPNTALEFEL